MARISTLFFISLYAFVALPSFAQLPEVVSTIYMKKTNGVIYGLNTINNNIHFIGIEENENHDNYPMVGSLSEEDEVIYKHTNSDMKSCHAKKVVKTENTYAYIGRNRSSTCLACQTKDSIFFSNNYSSFSDDNIPGSIFFDGTKITVFSSKVYKKNGVYKRQVVIKEYNLNGKLLIEKKLASINSRSIEHTIQSNGGYIIMGQETPTEETEPTYNPFILILDNKLNILQDNSLLKETNRSIYPRKIIPLEDDNYLLVGSVSTGRGSSDLWLCQISLTPEETSITSFFTQTLGKDASVLDALLHENKVYVATPSGGYDNFWMLDMEGEIITSLLIGDKEDPSSLWSLTRKGNHVYVGSSYYEDDYHPIIYKVQIE